MRKIFTCIFFVSFFSFLFTRDVLAQSSNWSNKFEAQKVFVKNMGQFKINPSTGFDPKVQYAYDGHEQRFYFTSSGVVLEFSNYKKPKEKESEERELKERMKKGMTAADHEKMEAEEHRLILMRDQVM